MRTRHSFPRDGAFASLVRIPGNSSGHTVGTPRDDVGRVPNGLSLAQFASVALSDTAVVHGSRPRLKRFAVGAILLVGIPAAGFVALEGLSSLALFARATFVAARPLFPEEVSTQYDSEFGWVAKKSFSSPNMYGPGVGLNTNSRGFRGMMPVSDAVPNGKLRLVCSGDSFTLGWGVADNETWCAQLASDELDVVNMGQGGYGIDQAYLWYRRDGLTLDHDIHILAFVTHDFSRMAMDRFLGYAKPRLVVDADSLRLVGVPVPRRDRARFARRFGRAAQELRTAQLVSGLTRRLGTSEGGDPPPPEAGGTRDVFARLVRQLHRINDAKQSRLVLVYLPGIDDFTNDAALAWRNATRRIADSLGVTFIDLIPELRKRERLDVQNMYFGERDEMHFVGATGHFNATGNLWAAALIRARLDSLDAPQANAGIDRRKSLGARAPGPSLARGPRPRSSQAPSVPPQ